MANQITDNRTKRADAANLTDGITGTWVGSTSPAQDTDIYIEGAASIAEQMTNSRRWVMWNAGTTLNLTDATAYIWVNCGVVGLLDLKANGGFRIRFGGATATDFFEVNVGGSDSWPNAVSGGWVQFAVNVSIAQTTPSATGGTPPAASAIQHIGYSAITTAMTKVADNCWIDAIYTLAASTPGIIVEGRSGGTTDWTFADILTQLGQGSGAIKAGPAGSLILNTPLQIGINDTSTHGFSDTNATIFWDNQEWVSTTLYGISVLGNAGGTTNVTLGVKSGTGNDATGSQGITFQAASGGVQWLMDFDDPNVDSIGLYGCNFINARYSELDSAAVDLATCLFLDCQGANIANAKIVRATVVGGQIASQGFFATDDMGDIVYSSFTHNTGHAIQLTAATPTSQNNIGNLFSGYTNTVDSVDAAIRNAAAGAITISSSGGSNLQTNSYRNTGGGSVTILNNISITFTGMKDNSEVRVYNASTGAEIAGIEDATTGTTDNRSFTWSAAAATVVDYVIHNWQPGVAVYQSIRVEDFTVPGSDTSIPIQQIIDRNAV